MYVSLFKNKTKLKKKLDKNNSNNSSSSVDEKFCVRS